MSKTIGIRFSEEEEALLEKAMAATTVLGDRGGLSAWVRRVVLKEAQRVVGGEVTHVQ
jgi:hypothetical protein